MQSATSFVLKWHGASEKLLLLLFVARREPNANNLARLLVAVFAMVVCGSVQLQVYQKYLRPAEMAGVIRAVFEDNSNRRALLDLVAQEQLQQQKQQQQQQ